MNFEYKDTTYQLNVEDLTDPQKYISHVLCRVFIYHDECGICYEDFAQPEKGNVVYLNCNCKLGYHRSCITSALGVNNSCPQCRRPNPVIVNHKGNIQDLGAYENFYDQAVTSLESVDRLQFLNNWFEPVKDKSNSLRRSCLVNPFEYNAFTTFDTKWDACKLYREPESMHVNPIDQTSFKPGEQTVKDKADFQEEWMKVSQGIFLSGWSWDNVVISGGMPSKMLSRATKYYPETSDIDIYVYGKEQRDREDAIRRIIKFFADHKAWFVVKAAVIDIFIPGFARNFQLICGNYNTIDDILFSFDLTHIQVAMAMVDNDIKVWCTPEYLAAMKYQITQVDESKFKMRRVLKLVGTGMCLGSKRDIGDVAMFIKDRQTGHYIPGKDEDPSEVMSQFCQVYGVSEEQVTRDPAKAIHMVKTDVDIRSGAGYMDNAFLLEPRRFTNFGGLNVRQTGRNGYYTFKIMYPNLPYIILEVRQVRLKNVTATDETGRQISIECQLLNEEDRDILREFTDKIIKVTMDYVKDKPWIRMNHIFRSINNFKFNIHRRGTRVIENGKPIDKEYFVKNFQGRTVDATVVLNGIRCGYQATNGTVDYHFQEIRYNTET